jgi:hypothetical protein
MVLMQVYFLANVDTLPPLAKEKKLHGKGIINALQNN